MKGRLLRDGSMGEDSSETKEFPKTLDGILEHPLHKFTTAHSTITSYPNAKSNGSSVSIAFAFCVQYKEQKRHTPGGCGVTILGVWSEKGFLDLGDRVHDRLERILCLRDGAPDDDALRAGLDSFGGCRNSLLVIVFDTRPLGPDHRIVPREVFKIAYAVKDFVFMH